jgi:hypothetical protein
MEYKAYSFDLDDNLLKLPTKVKLKNKDGKIVEFSTLEYEEIFPKMGKFGFEVTKDSFSEFYDDEKFLIDLENASLAGSFKNLETCIVKHASIFSIITARGNSPKAIKEGLKKVIVKRLNSEKLEEFKESFIKKYGENYSKNSIDEVLDFYLEMCRFYPVNNKLIKEKFNLKDISELKSRCFSEFRDYVKKHVRENFGEDFEVKVGFSDDSIVHLNKMINDILKEHGLFFFKTKDDGKDILRI